MNIKIKLVLLIGFYVLTASGFGEAALAKQLDRASCQYKLDFLRPPDSFEFLTYQGVRVKFRVLPDSDQMARSVSVLATELKRIQPGLRVVPFKIDLSEPGAPYNYTRLTFEIVKNLIPSASAKDFLQKDKRSFMFVTNFFPSTKIEGRHYVVEMLVHHFSDLPKSENFASKTDKELMPAFELILNKRDSMVNVAFSKTSRIPNFGSPFQIAIWNDEGYGVTILDY